MEENLEQNIEANKEIPDKTITSKSEEIKKTNAEKFITKSENNSVTNVEIKIENNIPSKSIPKPKKEIPIEKKPFQEFINIHLIPALKEEIYQRGLEISNINLENTIRPIAGDK